MNFERINLKTLTKEMELIAKTFFEYRNDTEEVSVLADSDQTNAKHSQNSFVKRVEEAFSGLNPTEQLFINNDFFYEDYPDWWVKIYTKTQYSQYMKRSIVHFLRLFYEDDED